MESQIRSRFIKEDNKARFSQGDILKGVEIVLADNFDITSQEYSIVRRLLPYGVVVNQECDLEHDYNSQINNTAANQDKYLPNILILPAYGFNEFKSGNHREGLKGNAWSSDQMKLIKQNNNDRFHYIKEHLDYQIPELIIDFKHLYAVSRNILYKKMSQVYLSSTSEMFRESLSQRYCNYLSRIGLPEIN